MTIAGRNDPCPCGSGKKYKKCCGAVNYVRQGDGLRTRIAAEIRTALADGPDGGWDGIGYQFLDPKEWEGGSNQMHYLLLSKGHEDLAEKAAEMHKGRIPLLRFLLTHDLDGTLPTHMELGRRALGFKDGWGVLAAAMTTEVETLEGMKGFSAEAMSLFARNGLDHVVMQLRESNTD